MQQGKDGTGNFSFAVIVLMKKGGKWNDSSRLANALLQLGLKKGDRICFLLANSAQSIEIDYAILLCGLVRVPLNTRLSKAEHLHMIQETGAKAILFTEEFIGRVRDLKVKLKSVSYFIQMNGKNTEPSVTAVNDILSSSTEDEPAVSLHGTDVATLQYTSGTIGKLKAAVHTQETWAAMCNNILSSLRIEANDIMMRKEKPQATFFIKWANGL